MPCTPTGTCWFGPRQGDTLGISCSASNEREIEIWGWDAGEPRVPGKCGRKVCVHTGLTGHSMVCGLPRAHPGPSHHAVVYGEDPLTACLPGTLTVVSAGHMGCPTWASAFPSIRRGWLLAPPQGPRALVS